MEKTETTARRLLAAADVPARTVAAALGLSEPGLSLKLSGRRPFRPEELAGIRDVLNQPANLKKLGRRKPVTVDELLAEAAA